MPVSDSAARAAERNTDVWALVQASPDPMVVIQDGRHVFANDRALSLYRARDLAHLASKPAIEYMEPSLKTEALERMHSMAEDRVQLDYVDEAIIRLDGTRCDTEAAGSPIMFGGRPAALVVMRDISARLAGEAARQAAEERFRSAFNHAPVGMAVLDTTGTLCEANPALAEILRCPIDELLGAPVWRWIHPHDRHASHARFARLLENVSAVETAEVRLVRSDHEQAWGFASTSALRDSTGRPNSFVLQLQDMTARRSAEDELKHRASRDQLTGLANRSLFTSRLESALAAPDFRRGTPAVLFLDLDRFKVVNDSMGHSCGDELLIQVAARFRASLRPGDTAARLGGDEFAILLERIQTIDQAARAAARIQRSLAKPFLLDGTEVFAKASIGISLAEPGSDATSLLRDADMAMYRAKANGGGCFATFDANMRADCSKRMDIENGLYGALSRRELYLLYQPIVGTDTGKMIGVEALIRWKRASGEVVMPGEFIAIAEETGLIVPIGLWVLQQACRQMRLWRSERPDAPPLTMSVNVSSRQLATAEIAAVVGDLVSDMRPDLLALEITETAAAQISEDALRNLERLRDLGVSIAIDDLGTGHSSLARLRKLPVDVLKIDRQFIAGVATSEEDKSVVLAIIAMARALGLVTVAEGVEDEATAAILRGAKCLLSQGYLYGRPQPPEAIVAILASQSLPSRRSHRDLHNSPATVCSA